MVATSKHMDSHVQVLGWLFIGYGTLIALTLIALWSAASVLSLFDAFDTETFIREWGWLAILLLVIAAIPLAAGIGILRHQPWGRVLGFVVAALSVLSVPLGTALAVYAFWVLTRPEAVVLFDVGRVGHAGAP